MASSLSLLLLPSFAVLLSLTQTISVQSYSNITRSTTLTAGSSTSSWPSPSGNFAFGFFPTITDASLFLLAIWFDSTTPKSIVWTANRNTPVAVDSTLQLTSDGWLSLKDQAGTEVWSPAPRNVAAAALLDSGNLVLAGTSGILWQSFDVPTDTLLPGQVMSLSSSLRSQLTDTDFSDGRFELVAQRNGNFELRPLAVPLGNQYDRYWSVDTADPGSKLVYNESGSIYIALKNDTLLTIFPVANFWPENFYQRARLDPDGVVRQYIYPKNGIAGGSWREAWNVVYKVPSDICQAINSDLGSGACGYNSYCSSAGDLVQVNCMCPPQYSFIDPEYTYKGCAQDFLMQCKQYSSGQYEFKSIGDVDWPYSDYEHYIGVNEDQCRQYCLEDCFCAVAIYWDNNECWKKKLPLSNGKIGSSVDRRALIKVPKDNASLALPPVSGIIVVEKEQSTRNRIVVLLVLLGFSFFMNSIFVTCIVAMIFGVCGKRKQKLQPQISMSGLNLRVFTYKELEEATGRFQKELGRGAFGTVYKGVLPWKVNLDIAVKKLDRLVHDGEKEFTNEVRSIGLIHHKNLVKLIGYCNEGAHRLLVYEYMQNGSLMGFLFHEVKPRWEQRTHIILGIARGLLYLHEGCRTPIIHCDIKPQNVLIDENHVARIADFGLAKLLKTDQTRTNTGIRGTRGYAAPEWFKSTAITKKVDVYSFGVMMLEIICSRKNLETEIEKEEEQVLVYWAYDCYKDGKLELLVQNDEEALADIVNVSRYIKVAIWCIQEDPSLRPSMQRVTQMLEGAVEVSAPPDPSLSL